LLNIVWPMLMTGRRISVPNVTNMRNMKMPTRIVAAAGDMIVRRPIFAITSGSA